MQARSYALLGTHPIRKLSKLGWSDTQTITIDAASNGSSLSSQNPSATSEQSGSRVDVWFGLGWWQVATIVLGVVVVLLVFVVFYLRKRSIGGSVKKVTTV